jgi:hypothetical protein
VDFIDYNNWQLSPLWLVLHSHMALSGQYRSNQSDITAITTKVCVKELAGGMERTILIIPSSLSIIQPT